MPSFLDFDLSARVGEKRILHWAKHDILFQIKVQAEPSCVVRPVVRAPHYPLYPFSPRLP
eukprot:COSAG01_NODE_9152_length_2536_cov_1.477226_1_plen_60_part_00